MVPTTCSGDMPYFDPRRNPDSGALGHKTQPNSEPGAEDDAHEVHGGAGAELLLELGAIVGDGLV